jgi:formate-dependent nitrite reductase cytochrome c552 subunit
MNQDISYWLGEVQSLQKRLATVCEERDDAHQEASSWRSRYEAETKLRQSESQILQQKVAQLTQELTQFRSGVSDETAAAEIEADLKAITTPEQLQATLRDLLLERHQLRLNLQNEREAHINTRESLSIALGDAVDQLRQAGS